MNIQEACKILGVSLNASEDEIKKHWKKLAFENHPDRNNGSKESEEKLKEINQAYETLTKKKDDPFAGVNFNDFGGMGFNPFSEFANMFGFRGFGGQRDNTPPNTESKIDSYLRNLKKPISPAHLELNAQIPIDNLLIFTKSSINIKRFEICSDCNGLKVKQDSHRTCSACNGSGNNVFKNAMMTTIITCNTCGGIGAIFDICNNCDQNGFVNIDEEYQINPFIDNKLQLKHTISGYGLPGKNSLSNQRGDLYINIHVVTDGNFTIRSYNDILYLSNLNPIPINFSQVINHQEFTFHTFNAKTREIEWVSTKLNEDISFEYGAGDTVINRNDLTFGIIRENLGFIVNEIRLPYLVCLKLNPIIS